ncbi:MAG: 5-oxoprolinase subunit PxpB [Granulosicoccus sp.]
MNTAVSWTHHYAGDRALVLEFGQEINSVIVDQIVALDRLVASERSSGRLTGITETIPTFRSLAIMYDPLLVHPEELLEELRLLNHLPDTGSLRQGKQWLLPVKYGGNAGPDLAEVAQLTDLDEQQVIQLHEDCQFTVYMLGFLPGFAFLGDTPKALHLPRRKEPRLRVPAGSVAIALQLTGVYPWDSPGGWHILGNCPVPLFDAELDPPALLKAGDLVSFKAVDDEAHRALEEQVATGDFDRNSLQQASTEGSAQHAN